MPDKIINMFKINGLQYNALRDPQVYRRVAGEPFRIQAMINGRDTVRVSLSDEQGAVLAQGEVQAPGTFSHELRFDKPGVRIVTLTAHHADHEESHDLRLDIMAHAWIG